jgi:biofilm PGA synthesis N-glycosyltransferase PgaC
MPHGVGKQRRVFEVLVAIVPFHNEARFLGEFLSSLDLQTRPPDKLLLVDDDSSDGSREIALAFARPREWATVLHRPKSSPRKDRLAEGGPLAAFKWGLGQAPPDWDIVAKLDADLLLPRCAVAELEGYLTDEPGLGIAGAHLVEARDGRPCRIEIAAGHVHGAIKFYKRACWDDIAPVPALVGWDGIDSLRAKMRGWQSRSFELSCGDAVHMKPMGSRDGMLRSYRRRGRGSWVIGEHPLIVAWSGLRFTIRERHPAKGLHYLFGWLGSAVMRAPRADVDLRGYVRRQNLHELRQSITRKAEALRQGGPTPPESDT